jgi:tripeptide aminopeptidase
MVSKERLLRLFVELVQIDSPSGQEAVIARVLKKRLCGLGLEVFVDEIGNIIGCLPGIGEPLLLCAHMDTVQPGCGVKPVVKNGIVYSDGSTVLGADDKSGIAIIMEVLRALREEGSPSRPLEVVFTVQEELGVLGTKALDLKQFRARQGIVMDFGGPIGTMQIQAPARNELQFVVKGKAAHAGTRPEEGINAIAVAARGVAAMSLGRIDSETTANIGLIHGGTAVNVVPDRVELTGEARSHSLAKLNQQVSAMVQAMEKAVSETGAILRTSVEHGHGAFRLDPNSPWIRKLVVACDGVGVDAQLISSCGGTDANVFNDAGIECVNLSTGTQKAHTTEEQISLSDMITTARLVAAIVAN